MLGDRSCNGAWATMLARWRQRASIVARAPPSLSIIAQAPSLSAQAVARAALLERQPSSASAGAVSLKRPPKRHRPSAVARARHEARSLRVVPWPMAFAPGTTPRHGTLADGRGTLADDVRTARHLGAVPSPMVFAPGTRHDPSARCPGRWCSRPARCLGAVPSPMAFAPGTTPRRGTRRRSSDGALGDEIPYYC